MRSDARFAVRDAAPEDAAAIGRVHVATMQRAYAGWIGARTLSALDPLRYAGHWRGWIERGDAVKLAFAGDALLGFAQFGTADAEPADLGELIALYVAPDSWRRGVGSLLHDAALGALRLRRARDAVLWTIRENAQARAFYERHGWRADGGVKHDDGASGVVVTEVRYRRPLA
jgi:GNAT superfamily N-acetyltransferase